MTQTGSTRAQRARAQAEARRRKEARHRQALIGLTALVVVLGVVGAMVAIKLTGANKPASSASLTTRGNGSAAVPAVTAGDLARAGGDKSLLPKYAGGLAPLTKNGKPVVAYVGAEFCPLCAAERWPMIIALSRFGTFSGLQQTTSASNDSYPNTPTYTFRHSSYSSKYLVFQATENEDRQHKVIQQVPSNVSALFGQVNAYPFIDLGNKWFYLSAQYDPGILKGLSFQQIRQALTDPSSKVAKTVLPAANAFTATICKLTGDQPASACSSAVVKQLQSQLPTK